MVGASSTGLLDFLLGFERFTARAVVASIDPLIQIARVVHGLDKLAASDMVPLFTGLDEVVVRNVERPPDILELSSHFVDVLLGFHAQLSRALGHFDGVLVVAHQEMNGVALHPSKSSLHVGSDLLERSADVRATVGVVDRRGDQIARLVVHHPDPRCSPCSGGRDGTLFAPGASDRRSVIINRHPRPTSVHRSHGTCLIYHKRSVQEGGSFTVSRVMSDRASWMRRGDFREPGYQLRRRRHQTAQPTIPIASSSASGSGTFCADALPVVCASVGNDELPVVCASVGGGGVEDPGPNT